MRRTTIAAAVLALGGVVPTAGPAAADSSACTHHWSGPQNCVRLEGRNEWNAVIGIWTNPPKSITSRTVALCMNGHHFDTATATRVGKTLSYHWAGMDTGTDTELCVRFKGSRRMACDTTKYIGNRASL
ncbi:hypothetical protein [Streptomyces sp. NBC_01236]|uniref:hypothetical protein n=1 Tax=Streptomyces sp. NBC_01236 TaxID=2903789 RepID=UPI002E14E281|nr:hypothetical protein OG324_00115 [Streptomyces sp. NBC_01236]